ncbi:VOC family protein [Henriciella sp.]|uniref:VOC family protein n=1 Tax=Henriciella sp. TaxID=1968823 RepID=UPI0026026C33|nr:VOC family protein [Henriciella sp.]
MRLNQVTVPCTDYGASVAFYTTLGLVQIVDSPPRYARFECPQSEDGSEPATFSLHHVEDWPGGDDPLVYFECDRLDETYEDLTGQGIVFEQSPADQRWGWREARLRDPAGNLLCLYQAGEMRRFPPWRI